MKRIFVILLSLSLVSGASAQNSFSDYSGTSYNNKQAQRAQQVTAAQILGIRQVVIKGDPNEVLGTSGAALGALAVLDIAGTSGNPYGLVASTIIAAIVGGTYTNELAKKLVEFPGFEFTLKLQDGRIVTIAQTNIDSMSVGDVVYITQSQDGTLRVYKV